MSYLSRTPDRAAGSPWPVAAGLVPGLAGAALTLAGFHHPVTSALTLVFLLLTPACCMALLLPRLDPLTRVTAGGAFAVVLVTAVAQVMLTLSVWSVRDGVVVVAAVCALLAFTGVVVRRRAPRTDRPRAGG
jgi:hypothetical protein